MQSSLQSIADGGSKEIHFQSFFILTLSSFSPLPSISQNSEWVQHSCILTYTYKSWAYVGVSYCTQEYCQCVGSRLLLQVCMEEEAGVWEGVNHSPSVYIKYYVVI